MSEDEEITILIWKQIAVMIHQAAAAVAAVAAAIVAEVEELSVLSLHLTSHLQLPLVLQFILLRASDV